MTVPPDVAPPTSQTAATVRAAVEVIVPGTNGLPGASDVNADARVIECMEALQPGSTTLMARLLNMYARTCCRDATFTELTPPQRDSVLRALADDELDEFADLIDALQAYTLNGYFTEWSGYHPDTGVLKAPEVWKRMGFHGPVQGCRLP